MIAHEFKTIQTTFTKCFQDSMVFKRSEMDGNYFEADNLTKDKKEWLVVAAGIGEAEGGDLFRGNPKRAEKATAPLQSRDGCEMAILFVARPFSGNLDEVSELSLVVPFAPRLGVRWLELREAYIRVWDLPKNAHGLSDIRWEWDVARSQEDPHEDWLRDLKKDIGFNPAHSPSHLHLNTGRINPTSHTRPGDNVDQLRLATGKPNPLALILSIAAWLQNM